MVNVLVFEEKREFRQKIKDALKSFDVEMNIFESCTQEEAFGLMDKVSIDIFVLDLETHKKCNVECISKYLDPHNTIVIADDLTEEDSKKLVDMEVFDVLYKPVDINSFRIKINTLSRIVERRKAYDMDNIALNDALTKYIKMLDEDVLNA